MILSFFLLLESASKYHDIYESTLYYIYIYGSLKKRGHRRGIDFRFFLIIPLCKERTELITFLSSERNTILPSPEAKIPYYNFERCPTFCLTRREHMKREFPLIISSCIFRGGGGRGEGAHAYPRVTNYFDCANKRSRGGNVGFIRVPL